MCISLLLSYVFSCKYVRLPCYLLIHLTVTHCADCVSVVMRWRHEHLTLVISYTTRLLLLHLLTLTTTSHGVTTWRHMMTSTARHCVTMTTQNADNMSSTSTKVPSLTRDTSFDTPRRCSSVYTTVEQQVTWQGIVLRDWQRHVFCAGTVLRQKWSPNAASVLVCRSDSNVWDGPAAPVTDWLLGLARKKSLGHFAYSPLILYGGSNRAELGLDFQPQ